MVNARGQRARRGAKSGSRRAGQALTEFVVMAGVLVMVLGMLALFLYTFRAYGGRVLDLVASEFP